MTKLEQIEREIESLTPEELSALQEWFDAFDAADCRASAAARYMPRGARSHCTSACVFSSWSQLFCRCWAWSIPALT